MNIRYAIQGLRNGEWTTLFSPFPIAPSARTMLAKLAKDRREQAAPLRVRHGARAIRSRVSSPKYRAATDPFGASRRRWADGCRRPTSAPTRDGSRASSQWDAYLLRSASVYEELCGTHTITQGGYYQYVDRAQPRHAELAALRAADGLHGARARARAPALHDRDAVGERQPARTAWARCASASDLGTSGDLDFWIFLAVVEYGLGARDLAFFDEPAAVLRHAAPASVWDHVKLAYQHQESLRGPNGGYLAGTNGDWSDFSTVFLQMTESLLVSAQLAYVYPRLAELADRARRSRVRPHAPHARQGAAARPCASAGPGKGWYARGLKADGSEIGTGAIFGEPQPWAILAGAPTKKQARTLVANHRRFLGGVGAPAVVNGPSKIGSSLSPASNDPDVTERSQPPGGVGDNNAIYVGGTWFDVNGWLTWSLGELDGIVPNARDYAWDEYTRNTLATHATAFPDHWAGTISIDDVCYSYYSSRPEQCGNDLYRDYDGQITEQPTWMVMDAIRLAGITPTAAGYRIAPHLPFETFSLRLPRIGVAASPGMLRGYVRVVEAGRRRAARAPAARCARRAHLGGRHVRAASADARRSRVSPGRDARRCGRLRRHLARTVAFSTTPARRAVSAPMRRRTFLKLGAAAASGLATLDRLVPFARAEGRTFDPQPGAWRAWKVTTRIEMLKPSGTTRVWVPLPAVDGDYQTSLGDRWTGNAKTMEQATDGKSGATVLYAEFHDEAAPVLEVASRVRTRDRAVDWSAQTPKKLHHVEARRWTAPTDQVPTDGIVAETAKKIADGKTTDRERVAAVYDWVLETMWREPTVRGCGVGDVKTILETQRFGGKCGDINGVFVGLVRALGIPARDVYGLASPRPASATRRSARRRPR